MSEPTPGFEHSQLKGITIKNMIVTVVCTATIVASVLGSYNALKNDLIEQRYSQEEQNKILDIRIRVVEDQQKILSQQIRDLQAKK